MILSDGTTVRTGNGVLIWNGLQEPNKRETGSIDYNVSVAFPPSSPELAELAQVVDKKLREGIFQGQWPNGAIKPLDSQVDASKIPELAGHTKIAFHTSKGIPPLFDASGNQLDIMQAAQYLYPGCIVSVLADCYDFNYKSKGISMGLQGLMFVDPTAPKLAIGSGMSAAAVAAGFGVGGGGAQPATPAAAPAAGSFAGGPPAAPTAPPAAPAPANVPQMTPLAAGVTYEAYIDAGWTDQQLIENGLMVA